MNNFLQQVEMVSAILVTSFAFYCLSNAVIRIIQFVLNASVVNRIIGFYSRKSNSSINMNIKKKYFNLGVSSNSKFIESKNSIFEINLENGSTFTTKSSPQLIGAPKSNEMIIAVVNEWERTVEVHHCYYDEGLCKAIGTNVIVATGSNFGSLSVINSSYSGKQIKFKLSDLSEIAQSAVHVGKYAGGMSNILVTTTPDRMSKLYLLERPDSCRIVKNDYATVALLKLIIICIFFILSIPFFYGFGYVLNTISLASRLDWIQFFIVGMGCTMLGRVFIVFTRGK